MYFFFLFPRQVNPLKKNLFFFFIFLVGLRRSEKSDSKEHKITLKADLMHRSHNREPNQYSVRFFQVFYSPYVINARENHKKSIALSYTQFPKDINLMLLHFYYTHLLPYYLIEAIFNKKILNLA